MAVPLSEIEASNALLTKSLPQDPVIAVFGGTSGIGRATLLAFAARTTDAARIHLVGRSQSAADEIRSEVAQLNPAATLIFHPADCSLMREVDRVCYEILAAEKEHGINVAYLSAGAFELSRELTEEGLPRHMALQVFARARIAQQLLPGLARASRRGQLARLVVIAAGTKDGPIDENDFGMLNIPSLKIRGQMASMLTLVLAKLSSDPEAKGVSFVHAFPGTVITNFLRTKRTALETAVYYVGSAFMTLASWMGKTVPIKESGERHVWVGTSARFPPKDALGFQGVSDGKVEPRAGADGNVGSGAYTVDEDGSEANAAAKAVIKDYVEGGMMDKVWEYFNREFSRIEG